MKREVFFRTGRIERGARYAWRDGYARLTRAGTEYPWLTKREAQSAARARGARAIFYESYGDAAKALLMEG